LTFDGVRFAAYSEDHLPTHVHGFYADAEVLVELRSNGVLAMPRRDSIRPPNAKRSEVAKIVNTASLHREELLALFGRVHAAAGRSND
jgi:hypothetical protein